MSLNDNMGPVVSSNSYLNTAFSPYLNQFKVAHLNCRSINPSANSIKLDELKSILSGNLFDVFAISESWLHDNVSSRAVDLSGYKFCRNDRHGSRGGGLGLYISNKLRFKVVFKVSDSNLCESLFVELYFGSVKILLGVVYLPSGNIVSFEKEHRNLLLKYSNIIVVGDFNYNLFDPLKSNLFRSLCMRCRLSVAHNSQPTHFDLGKRSTSLIDFFLVSDISMISFTDQVQCPSVTDHALIAAAFTFNIERLHEFCEYRDFNNIDWGALFSCLNEFDDSSIFNATDVETKCSSLKSLFDRLFSCVPIVRRRIRYGSDTWMESSDIVLARSLRDLAFSAFQSNRSWQNWRAYCKLRNRAKNVIRREKRRHFSRVFWGLDSAGMWKILKESGCVGRDDVTWDGDLEVLNQFFVGNNGADDLDAIDFSDFDESNDSFSFRCVSEMEIFEALSKVKSKSIGVDGISIKFVNLIFPYISSFVLNLVNAILTTSVFPNAWKIARVVPIPKSGLVHEPCDLRPISILPVMSKVVEHIIKNQVLQSTFFNLYESQYAFRHGYNTTSLLLKLTDSIRENVNNDKLSVLVALDLSKAFNSINHVRMIYKLRDKFNFSMSACKLIFSYLIERYQFVAVKDSRSDILSLHCGVPQGSVLGPLLFIMYINDLPEAVNSSFCRSFIFADDVFLLFSSNRTSSEIFESRINSYLDRVLEWTSLNFLSINSSKTKAIMFGPTNRFFPGLTIFLGDCEIEFVNQYKCLGVLLDSKLSFKSHIDALFGRVWGALRRLYSTNIIFPFRVKKSLAHALLMSQVLYGLEVFSGTIGVNFNRLKRIVNTIVRFVYNVRRRNHISGYVHRFLGCSFNNFVKYRNLILFHDIIKNDRPLPLCKSFVFSRSARNRQIFIPRIIRTIYERSFVVRVARSWNLLPRDLRIFSQSNNAFRLKLLTHFGSL